MAVNEEHRQVEVARDLSSQARTPAHSTRDVPAPFDSYTLLGELVATVDDLQQVCQQLGLWHSRVVDGEHYAGEDNRGDGATGTVTAAAESPTGRRRARHRLRSPPSRAFSERRSALVRRMSGARTHVQRLVDAMLDAAQSAEPKAEHSITLTPENSLLRSEEHTSELQSLMRISYAVFCLKKKNKKQTTH